MERQQKEALVASLNGVFNESTLVIVTRPLGLTVAESTLLRGQMRAAGASFKVTKNRLVRRALEGTKCAALNDLFVGPTAIAYSQDPIAAAKVAVEFAEKNQKLTILGGVLDTEALDMARVVSLAKLPSLDELRGKIVGLLNAPATRIAGVLNAPSGQLARVMGAYAASGGDA